MPEDVLDVEGLDEIKAMVDRFVSREFVVSARAAMTETLLFLHGQIPEYPAAAGRKADTDRWTDKQRRYFFWALKKGIINVPYRRTGTLGREFTTEVRMQGAQVLGAIGTAVAYAPWVVGPDESEAITIGGIRAFQAAIHRGVWWQFEDVIEDNLDKAYTVFTDAFYRALEKGM